MAIQLNTIEIPDVSLTLSGADFEALSRVMLWRFKRSDIRKRLEWLYTHGGVTRPAYRKAESNVIKLGKARAVRSLERSHGVAVAAIASEALRKRQEAMTAFAVRFEAELAAADRIAAKKARRKARK